MSPANGRHISQLGPRKARVGWWQWGREHLFVSQPRHKMNGHCCCEPGDPCHNCWPGVEFELNDPIVISGLNAGGWTPTTDPECWWLDHWYNCGEHEYNIGGETKNGYVGVEFRENYCRYSHDGQLRWEYHNPGQLVVHVSWPVAKVDGRIKWEVVEIFWGCLPEDGHFVYDGDDWRWDDLQDPGHTNPICCSSFQEHYYTFGDEGDEEDLPVITGISVQVTVVQHYWYNCENDGYYHCVPVADDPTADYYDYEDCNADCREKYVCDDGRCRPTEAGETPEYSDYYDCYQDCTWWRCNNGYCSNGYDAQSGEYETQEECEENCQGGWSCNESNWSCSWSTDGDYADQYDCYYACRPGYVCENNSCRQTVSGETAEYYDYYECDYYCRPGYVCDAGTCRESQSGETPDYHYYEECQYYCTPGYVCDGGTCREAQSGETAEYQYYEECAYYCE